MKNSATQNPNNKVGRNSGFGPGGETEIVPTQEEAANGLSASGFQAPTRSRRLTRRQIGIGAMAVVGTAAGVGAAFVARQRHQRSWLDTQKARIKHML